MEIFCLFLKGLQNSWAGRGAQEFLSRTSVYVTNDFKEGNNISKEKNTEQKEKRTGERMWRNAHVYGQKVVEESVKEIKRNKPERKRKICNITEARGYIRYKRQTTEYRGWLLEKRLWLSSDKLTQRLFTVLNSKGLRWSYNEQVKTIIWMWTVTLVGFKWQFSPSSHLNEVF